MEHEAERRQEVNKWRKMYEESSKTLKWVQNMQRMARKKNEKLEKTIEDLLAQLKALEAQLEAQRQAMALSEARLASAEGSLAMLTVPRTDAGTATEADWPSQDEMRHMAEHNENLMAGVRERDKMLDNLKRQLREEQMRRQAVEGRAKAAAETKASGNQKADDQLRDLGKSLSDAKMQTGLLRGRAEEAERQAKAGVRVQAMLTKRLNDMEDELAELRRLKNKAWAKNAELAQEAQESRCALESEWMNKLLSAIRNVKVGVVAPSVTINFNTGAGGVKAMPSMPSDEIERCLQEEILPKFLRVFTENNEDVGLAQLVDIAKVAAPAQCEWLVTHLDEMKGAVEHALAGGTFSEKGSIQQHAKSGRSAAVRSLGR
jgi:predicted  nucleic acid-binding Zn-ribbon protein